MSLQIHEKWMRKALALASKGKYSTAPNPMVGACVVKNGKLIASGFHKEFGGPHAERMALEKIGKKAVGATLYVTLEPCSTWQKTPPCASLIVEKKIKKVVIGSLDPNPLNRQKGVRYLRRCGVKVEVGVLEGEVREQNKGFFTVMTAKRPFVTLKMAETLDGKIATHNGSSRWVSSSKSREFVHQLRTEQDAVLVGANTFYADNPRITAPSGAECLVHGKPWKIIMISDKTWTSKARIFEDDRLTILVFAASKAKSVMKTVNKIKRSFTLLPVKDKKGRIDIAELLKKLAALGITKLLVEGGGELAWSFIKAGCVDCAIWIIAPKVFGGRDAKTSVEGDGVTLPAQAYSFSTENVTRSGEDWIFEGTFRKGKR